MLSRPFSEMQNAVMPSNWSRCLHRRIGVTPLCIEDVHCLTASEVDSGGLGLYNGTMLLIVPDRSYAHTCLHKAGTG